ncbi:MAG: MFS transporter [Oscillospiraceae bacterium]|nr:MFS transporter [Oscillospiraceae bacterium]
MTHPDERVGAKRLLLWTSRSVSQGCHVIILGFLAIYCTDTLLMPASLVGVLLMVSKIFDAFASMIAGYIVDKTNTKLGRGRPYELSIIGLWFCTWLLYSCPPEFGIFAKSAWVLAMYIFINSIFSTFLHANNLVYMVRAFPQKQFVALTSYGNIIVMLFTVGVKISFPILMAKIATSAQGWSSLMAIYAIPLGLIGLLRFITIKENAAADVKANDSIRLKDVGILLKTNPYIYIVAFMGLIFNLAMNMGITQYYFTYIVKNMELMGVLALTQATIIPLILIFPRLIKRVSPVKVITAGIICMCVGYLVNFIALDRFPLLVTGALLTGVGGVPIAVLGVMLTIDCADYNEWKKRPRMEGTLSSVNAFAGKLGTALGAGLLGILLGVSGYTGVMDTMPESAFTMIRLMYSVIPIALFSVVIVALRFYKLDKLMPQIRGETGASKNER